MKTKILTLALILSAVLLSGSTNTNSGEGLINEGSLSAQDPSLKIIFISNRDGMNQIYTMDLDGANQRRITKTTKTIYKPVVSPDGRYIAYYNEDYELWVCNIDGSNSRKLSLSNEECMEPSWSPDGRKLVYASTRGNYKDEDGDIIRNIWEMDMGNNQATQLTFAEFSNYCPSYAPDGRKIVFESLTKIPFTLLEENYVSYRRQICVMNTDGSDQKRLSAPSAYIQYDSPHFSPDGNYIIYSMQTVGSDSDDWSWSHIYIMNQDGSHPERISKLNSFDEHPCWTPAGDEVLFETVINGQNLIILMKKDGTNQRILTDASADNFTASFFRSN